MVSADMEAVLTAIIDASPQPLEESAVITPILETSNQVTETPRNLPEVTQLWNWQSLNFTSSPCSSGKSFNHYAERPLLDKARSQQRSEGRDGIGLTDTWATHIPDRGRASARAPRKQQGWSI